MGKDMQISNVNYASEDGPNSPNKGDIDTMKLCFAFF